MGGPVGGRRRADVTGRMRARVAARHPETEGGDGMADRTGDDKRSLPLPPPTFLGRPWRRVIEEASSLLDRELVAISGGTVTIGGDDGWRVLRTVIPGVSFEVTYPGRAIGRWNLSLQGPGDDARWRLVRASVGPGADWEHHVLYVGRRLARFLADPGRYEFLIVEGPDGYVQVCTTEHDTAIRYEAAGEMNLARPAAIAPGLFDRLRVLGFDGPDAEAEGNYSRVGPAPVDAHVLAEDMLIVLADAYGLGPEDRVKAIDATTRDAGNGTRRLLPVHLAASSAGARVPTAVDRGEEPPGSGPSEPPDHGPAGARAETGRVGEASGDERPTEAGVARSVGPVGGVAASTGGAGRSGMARGTGMETRPGEMPQPETMSYARIAAEWVPLRAKGWDLLLEFTCAACGASSFHSRPNELPPTAICETCGAVVDVEATGGWFAIVRQVESKATERAEAKRQRDLAAHPVDAVADIEATFGHHRLPLWPIPDRFRPGLRRPDDWLWTTRAIDPMEMYLFRRYPAEATDPSIADYLAISHAGHGVNSYALSYHLVMGPLGLFAQVLWGGVYADDEMARANLERQATLMRELIPLAEDASNEWDGRRRLIVAESAFRGIAICTWVDLEPALGIPGDVDQDEASWSIGDQLGRRDAEDPLAEAIRELGGRPSELGEP